MKSKLMRSVTSAAFAALAGAGLAAPAIAQGVRSIAQSALVKSVSLFKMASADPFSTVAFLRTMAEGSRSQATAVSEVSGAIQSLDSATQQYVAP